MNARTFNPGFRFSKLDAIVLMFGFIGSAGLAAIMPWIGAAIAFVIAHFFLFCNLVRMGRRFELLWAALFLVLAALTILRGQPAWPITFAISFAGTVLLIALELRRPSYHGVFWQYVNPNLSQWWELHGDA
jgi:hypothetical protein